MDPSEDSWKYQQQAIDADIKSLKVSLRASIRALRSRRNSLAPILSLPTEITTLIFSFLRPTSSASLKWLRVAHVCHQWREIALNQPLLWSHINFTNLSSVGAAAILDRAKTAPLYLEARAFDGHWDNARFSAFEEQLLACVPRICRLSISTDIPQFPKTLERLISPAPTLERLSLDCREPIPETLFSGITPRLSCLELHGGCGIGWKSPLLRGPGLRYLDVFSPSAESAPSLSVWLDALDEMPQLKMLTLEVASPTADDGGPFPFDVKRTATLPSLTHFNISDSPRNCAFALAHLDLPALTCLNVKVDSFLRDGNDVRDVFPYIGKHAHGSQDTQPLQSILIRGKQTRADFLVWPVPNINVELRGSTLLAATAPARVALSFWCENWNHFDAHNEVLGMAMAAIPLDGLVTLITHDFQSPPFEQFWLPNLPRLPLLQHVRLAPIVATRFIDWLQADNGDSKTRFSLH